MKKYLYIYISAFLVLNLVGCGTKGSLYIPEKKYPQNTTPTETK
jgi:predicted small lipoprotein YifL